MNIREKLIEALNKEHWIIDTYCCHNRHNSLLDLLKDSDVGCPVYKKRYIEKMDCLIFARDEDRQDLSEENRPVNITQIFNEYLAEYEADVWLHSVIAAMQEGVKVESYDAVSEMWYRTHEYIRIYRKHRIDYKEPAQEKLVPDEIWDMLDESYKFITMDSNHKIFASETKPERSDKVWQSGDYHRLDGLKLLKNAKIYDVDWKDSLCLRPNK